MLMLYTSVTCWAVLSMMQYRKEIFENKIAEHTKTPGIISFDSETGKCSIFVQSPSDRDRENWESGKLYSNHFFSAGHSRTHLFRLDYGVCHYFHAAYYESSNTCTWNHQKKREEQQEKRAREREKKWTQNKSCQPNRNWNYISASWNSKCFDLLATHYQ